MLDEPFLAVGWDLSTEDVSVTKWRSPVGRINSMKPPDSRKGPAHETLFVTKWRSLVGHIQYSA